MPLKTYPGRVLWITAVSCLLLLGLCTAVALLLFREQDRTARVLSEDIGSRGAAVNLEATLNNLITLLDRGIPDVGPLHDQVREDLREIRNYADKDREKELATQTTGGFDEYLDNWREKRPTKSLADSIRLRVLKPASELRQFNGKELKQSELSHRQALQHMVWGLAIVAVLGPLSGLIFGYKLARSLQRTIHQFLVRVQGATDLLGQGVPAVEWQREGEPLQDGGAELLHRVEQVVQRLQQRETEAKRAERLAAVGQLAAGVAHEIRNPLTSAILLIETGRRDAGAAALTDYDLDLILQELHRIESSLQQFLDFARPPKIARVSCDLGEIVRDAVSLVRGRIERAGVIIDLDLPKEGSPLLADRDQLRQVVLNLILNAIDVMPHGGKLTVSIRPTEGKGLDLNVEDEGTGISPEILPRLFEPFATGKETGLGLGLVVSKRIVEDHRGRISGRNRPNGGAVFNVLLPKE